MIYVGYGKPQTSQVKLKISPSTGEAKFSLGEAGKNFNASGLLQKSVFMPGVVFVERFQNMFHAGHNTRCTGLGVYGVPSDKVHAKLYTLPKMLFSVFRSFSTICFYETE